MIVVTGATGHLGTHVLELLLERVDASSVRALARTPDKAARWAERGVEVVQGDYEDPASLRRAFAGADQVLLISSSEVGRRLDHHTNVIEAAEAEGVERIVYTSLLHADTSHSMLADEHLPTEQRLEAADLDHVILRNGWYTENYTENLAPALEAGAFYGAADDGRIAAAPRRDYAAAAVAVLTEDGHTGATYELAGPAFTMSELADTVSEAVGRDIGYVDLPEADYRAALVDAGLPEGMATMLADADTAIAQGDLDGSTDDLEALIGRPPTPLSDVVEQAVADLEEEPS